MDSNRILRNGLKIQWMKYVHVSNTATIYLPISFSTSNYVISAIAYSNHRAISDMSKQPSYFTATCGATDVGGTHNSYFDILCIGY